MNSVRHFLLVCFAGAAACVPSDEQTAPAPHAAGSSEGARLASPATELDSITEDAVAQVAHLLSITSDGRLTPLVREAEKNEDFQSNFGGQSHSRHWSLLRRVGVDPVDKLHAVLDQPFAAKQVGTETWFVWPDFATLEPDALIPERLNFQDRARLLELIGEDGVTRIRNGEPYPGVRTAISEKGRWVYFFHGIDTSEEP